MIDHTDLLSEMSQNQLMFRHSLGREIVKLCRQMEKDGEEGAREAKERYIAQLREITLEIRKRRKAERAARGGVKPPTESIKLKTASLGAKTDNV